MEIKCYYCGLYYPDNSYCCCHCLSAQPKPEIRRELTQAQLPRHLQWQRNHGCWKKTPKRDKERICIILLGLIIAGWCLGFWLGIQENSKSFGCGGGIGLLVVLFGLLYPCICQRRYDELGQRLN